MAKNNGTEKRTKYRRTKPAKVYRNEEGKVVYRQSTDKVGDELVNQAGVKFKITGQSFHPTTGYDDGKLKVRVLEITPEDKRIPKFEMGDGSLKDARERGILSRISRGRNKPKPKAVQPAKQDKPKKATTYTVKGKTFATLAEAKAYKAAQKAKAGKPCEIKESTRKPSHKVVTFTAKAKK